VSEKLPVHYAELRRPAINGTLPIFGVATHTLRTCDLEKLMHIARNFSRNSRSCSRYLGAKVAEIHRLS